MQESAAKKTIREKVMNKPIATVRAMTGDALLNKNDLKKISKELSLQIIDCQVNDLDFSDKLQEAENAVGRATVLARMTKILVTDGGYDQKMAQEIAPFLLDNLKMDKQVKEYNFKGLTIPEEIITKIINLIKK